MSQKVHTKKMSFDPAFMAEMIKNDPNVND